MLRLIRLLWHIPFALAFVLLAAFAVSAQVPHSRPLAAKDIRGDVYEVVAREMSVAQSTVLLGEERALQVAQTQRNHVVENMKGLVGGVVCIKLTRGADGRPTGFEYKSCGRIDQILAISAKEFSSFKLMANDDPVILMRLRYLGYDSEIIAIEWSHDYHATTPARTPKRWVALIDTATQRKRVVVDELEFSSR